MSKINVQEAYRPIPTNGLPTFTASEDQNSDYYRFWDEQFRRCISGYKPEGLKWIPGRLYFYLNFCKIKIKDETGQRKKVDYPFYRELDYELSMKLEKAKYEKKGIIEPKAREVGATVGLVCMTILHETTFFEASEVAIATGTPDEIIAAKEVLSLAYNELVDELRSDRIQLNSEVWKFGFVSHETYGDGKKSIDKELGLKSKIHFKDSLNRKPNQLNSFRLAWSFIEECGLINGLRNIHILNRASFEEDLVQFGCPIYAGTAKSFASKDNDYEYMYEHCDQYNLIQNFIPKRKAMLRYMDYTTGVVDEVAAQEEINRIYEPHKGSQLDLAKVQQEYPSEPEHCWMRKSGGLLPLDIINSQIKNIKEDKKFNIKSKQHGLIEIGDLKWVGGFGKRVDFFPNPKGKMMVLRQPKKDGKGNFKYQNGYCGGVDPYNKVATVESDSMGACYIYERMISLTEEEPTFVLRYVDRPVHTEFECGMKFVEKDIFYNNLYKIAVYYGCKLLVEDTDQQLFSKFKEWNASFIALARKPKSVVSVNTKQQNLFGINRTTDIIGHQTDALNEELVARPNSIMFIDLLQDMRGWQAKNTDEADAASYALLLNRDMTAFKHFAKENKIDNQPVSFGSQWTRNGAGQLVCVSDQTYLKELGR